MMPHPATQIMVWICLACLVQTLTPVFLYVFAGVLLLCALLLHARRLFILLRRTRWILLSLLLIYAFMTPGEALWLSAYLPSPTREGLLDGMVQLGRLVCILAGLSILLTLLPRERMIGGLYALCYPLRYIGLSRERIAVRLALTLDHAESTMRETATDWRGAIRHALASGKENETVIELHVQSPGRIDAVLWLAAGGLLIGIWL